MLRVSFKNGFLRLGIAFFAFGACAANAADRVSIGLIGSISDAPFFVAEAKGYFAEEGIELETSKFDSAARMVAPMGSGDLEVGAGAVSAGLYNAIERGIKIKIVADKARNSPGNSYSAITVRKALVDEGKVKSFADFRGLKVAAAGPGISDLSTINQALKSGGLNYSDVEIVYLGMGQHAAAFANGAIDAALDAEPFATGVVRQGGAVKFATIASFYPNQQTSVVLFSEKFLQNQAVATRFLRAYLKGCRYYNTGVIDGKYSGERGDEIVSILAKYSNVNDPAFLRSISPSAVDANGQVDMNSLRTDLDFFVAQGWVKDPNLLAQAVDTSIIAKLASEMPVK